MATNDKNHEATETAASVQKKEEGFPMLWIWVVALALCGILMAYKFLFG